jgi:hypothetical protein
MTRNNTKADQLGDRNELSVVASLSKPAAQASLTNQSILTYSPILHFSQKQFLGSLLGYLGILEICTGNSLRARGVR